MCLTPKSLYIYEKGQSGRPSPMNLSWTKAEAFFGDIHPRPTANALRIDGTRDADSRRSTGRFARKTSGTAESFQQVYKPWLAKIAMALSNCSGEGGLTLSSL